MRTFDEIEDMTIREYEIRGKAFQLERLDRERESHKQAWLSRIVSGTNKKGEYIFESFNDFFKEKKVKQELGIEKKPKGNKDYKRLAEIALQVNSREEMKK